jgi:hypothetical protein
MAARGDNNRAVAAANRAKVAAALAAGCPAVGRAVAAATGLTRQTADRHLRALGVDRPGVAAGRAALAATRERMNARGEATRARIRAAIAAHLDDLGRVRLKALARAVGIGHRLAAYHLDRMPDAPPRRPILLVGARSRATRRRVSRVADSLTAGVPAAEVARREGLSTRTARRFRDLYTAPDRAEIEARIAAAAELKRAHSGVVPRKVFREHLPWRGPARAPERRAF